MIKKIIIDSSVSVKWINQIDEDLLEQADKILLDVQAEKIVLFAPELSKYEIGNALLRKQFSTQHVKDTIHLLYQLPITFVPETEDLAKQTYMIAHETGMTYYDASFVALAKQEDALLVTHNAKHQGKSTTVKVISLKDYSTSVLS